MRGRYRGQTLHFLFIKPVLVHVCTGNVQGQTHRICKGERHNIWTENALRHFQILVIWNNQIIICTCAHQTSLLYRCSWNQLQYRQGCCAGNGKFQYYVNSVYFCQFQYFLRLFMSQNQYNITSLIALNDCITNFPELEFWVENLQKDWMARNEFASLLKKTSTVKLWYYLSKYWV